LLDESGFYLLPGVVKTYSPRGHSPVLKVTETDKHLSVIAGITISGDLYTRIKDSAYKAIDIVLFLRHLIHIVSNRLLVIWDGSPIHKSDVVYFFLTQRIAKHVQVERLPPYAPDLNPSEAVWNHLKNVNMKNLCCFNFEHLRRELALSIVKLRSKPHLVRSFFDEAKLDIS
jgi:transposase